MAPDRRLRFGGGLASPAGRCRERRERARRDPAGDGGDGSKLVERLEAFDPDLHAYRYAIVESNLPIKDYTAEFRIDEAGADESLVVWTARFDSLGADADESAALVDQFLRAGVEALAEAFE